MRAKANNCLGCGVVVRLMSSHDFLAGTRFRSESWLPSGVCEARFASRGKPKGLHLRMSSFKRNAKEFSP